jgi:DNA-binding winged helix-turn-helix (wHTH) protein
VERCLEKYVFGAEYGPPFQLEITWHPDNPDLKHHTLFREGKRIKLEKQALFLLTYLLRNPQQDLSEKQLEDVLSESDSRGSSNVEQQIHSLRVHLVDDKSSPRFIETIPKYGYRFLVRPEFTPDARDAPAMKLFDQWDPKRFLEFIAEAERGDGDDREGDLRILTTAFSSGVPDSFPKLLREKNLRIRILMANETLMEERNAVRANHPPPKARRTRKEQRDTLDTLKTRTPPGNLDVLETNLMPYAFLAHSSKGALLGIFLATESYAEGPMIVVGPGTTLWGTLLTDWKELWKRAEHDDHFKQRTPPKERPKR